MKWDGLATQGCDKARKTRLVFTLGCDRVVPWDGRDDVRRQRRAKRPFSRDSKEEGNVPRPRLRRLLRISLRTTLVVVTVLCLLLGLKVRRAERQKEAVAWVKKIGGNVGYDYEHHENGKPIDDPRLPGPQWLLDYLGVDYFASVEFVWIDYSNVADLSPLVNLPNLSSTVRLLLTRSKLLNT